MWVIVDWTDTQVIGIFNSKEYAEQWFENYWHTHSVHGDEQFPGMDMLECSIHKIVNTSECIIRVDA